jgi:hypothetical protein
VQVDIHRTKRYSIDEPIDVRRTVYEPQIAEERHALPYQGTTSSPPLSHVSHMVMAIRMASEELRKPSSSVYRRLGRSSHVA